MREIGCEKWYLYYQVLASIVEKVGSIAAGEGYPLCAMPILVVGVMKALSLLLTQSPIVTPFHGWFEEIGTRVCIRGNECRREGGRKVSVFSV